MKPYRFLFEADQEFHEQIAWFDARSFASGGRFIDAVEAAIRDVRTHPEIGPIVARRVRQRVLQDFEYSVMYIDTPDEIIIVAIAPHKRRPRYWQRRLRGSNS